MEMILNGEKVNSSTTLTYVANPKKTGSLAYARYEKYSKFNTIEEYITKCAKSAILKSYARADLRWDHDKGFIELNKPIVVKSKKTVK